MFLSFFYFYIEGIHHYDSIALKNPLDEPPQIQKIHKEIIAFVKSWLEDWDDEHGVEE